MLVESREATNYDVGQLIQVEQVGCIPAAFRMGVSLRALTIAFTAPVV